LAGKFYDAAELLYRQGDFANAETLYRDIIELRRPHFGAEQKEMLDPNASLARLLSDWAWAEHDSPNLNSKPEMVARAREAERLLRHVLEVRLRENPESWRIGDSKSRLGGALLAVAVTDPEARQEKLTEAESLLFEGHEQLQENAGHGKYKRDALQRLLRLYKAWNKPDQAQRVIQRLEEALERMEVTPGPHHQDTRDTMRYVADTLAVTVTELLRAGEFAKAEPGARECLHLREKLIPDEWLTFNAKSMVGRSLLGQKQYEEAEPFLLAGYEGMMERTDQIPFVGRPRLKETLQRLVQLYEKTDRPERAAQWRQKMTALPGPVTEGSPEVQSVIVPSTSEWKWLHPMDGTDPKESDADFHTTFFTIGFDNALWQSGTDSDGTTGGFGYGDDWFKGVNIGLPGVTDENGKRNGKSAYFRHRFTTTNAHANLELRCQRDDGIIVYLDGKEVARENMSEGEEAYDLSATRAVGGVFETTTYRIPLMNTTLDPGEHILAISLHNPAISSSDLRIGGISLVEVATTPVESGGENFANTK
jgi:hypothetical protein